jgi:hypothetical protein
MAKVAQKLTRRQETTQLLQCSGHCLPHRRATSETEVQAPTTSTSSNAIQCHWHCRAARLQAAGAPQEAEKKEVHMRL